MRRSTFALALLLAAPLAPPPAIAAAADRPRYDLDLTLDPPSHGIEARATVTVGAAGAERTVEFLLNGRLALTASNPAVSEVPLDDTAPFFGINGPAQDVVAKLPLKRYRLRLPAGAASFEVAYRGTLDFELSEQKEEYTRGFRETLGRIAPEGVYLSATTMWYPVLGPDLVEFKLQARAPDGWHVISQGNGSSRGEDGLARWESGGAMDEIYLVGGPLEVFRDSAGVVEALVYLHERDEALASKYLAATAQYVEMYRGLIGPYPYRKFALVENFWETGYGMPSFTLLGPKIVRFPFIINSSYPHEILHNWWGNSVFVDYPSGNWCEGLTAYLADHLIEEQRGKGAEYRRATLQKYRDFVRSGRDFPLTEFRSRESAATEAVGYGKSLMGFHMLRERLGDDAFRKLLARFYREFRGKRASFADIEKVASGVGGQDLKDFFADWIGRTGAAELKIEGAKSAPADGGFAVSGTLVQAGPSGEAPPFRLDLPVVVQTEAGAERQMVRLGGARTPFTLKVAARPLALQVDPEFDVFRRLDPRETPPSVGQIFGQPRVLALLPSSAPADEQDRYRALVQGWQSPSHEVEVKLDREVKALPADRPVWLLGRKNLHAAAAIPPTTGYQVGPAALAVGGESMPLAGHTFVLIARHPGDVEKAIGWIVAEPAGAFPGLGRKLPHYGKYSYLGFEGEEPANVLKGQLDDPASPLRVDLRPAGERQAALPALKLPARKALAELPPVFSVKDLSRHVAYLADPAREGRGPGGAGHEAAADYIAAEFQKMGLKPAGDGGSYFQSFPAMVAKAKTAEKALTPAVLRNVLAVLPGTKAEWAGQSVVVCAHYDHLGRGWPDVHGGDEGRVHPGADDNASGVAVLLELARVLSAGDKPGRSIVFAAFTGEEAGRLGSLHYADHPGAYPIEQVMGVVNLDTVGRLGIGKLEVLGAGTASEWPHIFRGAMFVTGIDSKIVSQPLDSSDQATFVARGVPAVQLFTGAHADYHRPGDTADKVDVPGLVKVATVAREAIGYLGERPEPLTRTIASAAAAPAAAPAGAPTGGQPAATRKVLFGTVPDFGFEGPGVKVDSLSPGGPAEKAGIKPGDILKAIDGKPVASLGEYSALLKTLSAGQTVKATLERDGKTIDLSVTVVER